MSITTPTTTNTHKPINIIGMKSAATAASAVASQHTFELYRAKKSENTARVQLYAIRAFSDFLRTVGVHIDEDRLYYDPMCWADVSWGLVEAFNTWQLEKGVSISTINGRLSAVKTYAKLAGKAGALNTDEVQRIRLVTSYSRKAGKKADDNRDVTRIGSKKATHITITPKQAKQLKAHNIDTAQGARDALIMCILLDHGLRCGEVAGLLVTDFNVKAGELKFYRPKVDKVQTHRLTADTLTALLAYLDHAPAMGGMIRSSRKGGKLTNTTMSGRAITKRVCYLGQKIGVAGLSAHDCRHYWATDAARNGTDAFKLQEAGGWSSLAMPRRYVEDAKIANQGVKLSA